MTAQHETPKYDSFDDLPIEDLREEIDRLDQTIVDAILERARLAKLITDTRMAEGGARTDQSRELSVLRKYGNELGQSGVELGRVILRASRIKLERKPTLS